MNEFDNISDEQLGCFIEDSLCEADCNSILDAVSCDADMDLLSISYHASKLVDHGEVTSAKVVPHLQGGMVAACMPIESLYQPMRECAFLGDADIYACSDNLELSNESDEEISLSFQEEEQ